MDINELKKMLKNSTAVLIMDNGEPSFVVVNYQDYKNLLNKGEQEIKVHAAPGNTAAKAPAANDLELLERINKDILALKAQIEEEENVMAE